MKTNLSSSRYLLDLLKKITASITQEFTYEEILFYLVDIVKHELHVQNVAIILFDEKCGYLCIKAARGLSQGFMTKFLRNDEVEMVSKLLYGGESIMINEIDPASSVYEDLKLESDYISVLASRVAIHAQTMGYVICQRTTEIIFDDTELMLFEIIAQVVASAINEHQLMEENQALTLVDKETEIYKFKFFCDRLSGEMERARTSMQSISILLIDIDHYKVFCRLLGNEKSIELLRNLIEITREHLNGIDFIGRYGRDQITIALINQDEENAYIIAQDICRKFSDLNFCDKPNTVSIGVYHCLPDKEYSISHIYNNLGMTVFEARYHGGNRVCKWSECIYGDTR